MALPTPGNALATATRTRQDLSRVQLTKRCVALSKPSWADSTRPPGTGSFDRLFSGATLKMQAAHLSALTRIDSCSFSAVRLHHGATNRAFGCELAAGVGSNGSTKAPPTSVICAAAVRLTCRARDAG